MLGVLIGQYASPLSSMGQGVCEGEVRGNFLGQAYCYNLNTIIIIKT